MKRFYTLVVIALVAIAASFGVSAESITLKITDPNALSVMLSYSPVEITAGENVIEYDPNTYPSIQFKAADGFKLVSIVCETAQYSDVSINNGTEAILYLSSYNDGYVYNVTTQNLTEARTASATIKVPADDVSLVRVVRNGGMGVTLTGAETEVKFIPGEETPFSISRTDYSSIYKITVNDQPVEAPAYGYTYTVPVADGDVIEVTPNYPNIQVPVHITIPEEAKGAISYVQVNYNTVTNYLDDDFTVQAGSTLSMSFDTQNYNIRSIKVNDVVQSQNYSLNYTVGVDPLYIDIDAGTYGTIDFTINVDDPSHVTVVPGTSPYSGTPYTLVAGDNTFSISETIGSIYIKATSGYNITSLTDGDGNPLTLTYDVLRLTEGMVVNIRTAEKVYDGKFVVYIDSMDDVYTAYVSDEDTRENVYFSAGYNVVKFSTASNVNYMVTVSGSKAWTAYLNDEPISNDYGSSYFNRQFVPVNGEVYKVFTTGEAPESFAVSFSLDGVEASDVTVTTDLVQTRTDFADGFTALYGTAVSIDAPENAVVKIDEETLTPAESGLYEFNVTANTAVSITKATGIEDIAIDADSADSAVYNLQGIKVLDSAANAASLPAGIYISGGKKFVVR